MPKLYLVGVTEDRSGLVLAKSARAKKGDSVLEVSHDVLDAIAEIRRYRSGGSTPPRVKSPALPSRRVTAGEVSSPSALSPREIQSRLRRGESIQSVARRAGVEEWRVEVYAAPITAEQARVVAAARGLTMTKRGAGPSGRSLGESVQANIVEKRVSLDADEFESAWSAYEPEPERWVVRFEYVSRGARQRAEWIYDEDGVVTPANRVATFLGWRDPRRTGKLPPLPEAPRKPPAGPTLRKASAKKAPAKKAYARKAPGARTPSTKPVRKKPASKKTSLKRSAPKRKAPVRKASFRKKTPPRKTPPAGRAPSGSFQYLRIVEPPPEAEVEVEVVETRAVPERRSRGFEPSEGAKPLDLPSWVQPPAPAPQPPVRATPRGVSVDATPVTGRRRALRRRSRPLRPR